MSSLDKHLKKGRKERQIKWGLISENERWKQTELDLQPFDVPVIYLPHTPNISSSLLRVEVPNRVSENG